jgi:CHAT domain-containing protein
MCRDRVRYLRSADGWAAICCAVLLLACRRVSAPDATCKGSTRIALGVVWPGAVDRFDLRNAAVRRRIFARARALAKGGAVEPDGARDLPRLAALGGSVQLAVEAARAGLAVNGRKPEVRQAAAAVLLVGYLHSRTLGDLLDAGELLASRGDDVASRCNRTLVLERLHLSYLLAAEVADCPCAGALHINLSSGFPLDSHRHSADDLPASILRGVEELLARGDRAIARDAMWRSAQAWRSWFERGALEMWRAAAGEADRRAVEKRVMPLADLYTQVSANPAPARLWAELAMLPAERATVREGLGHFRQGMEALGRYDPDRVESELGIARPELALKLSALLPVLDLALAAARFHLGDDSGMLDRSLTVRYRVSRDVHPWAWARAFWLEALALQARADWSQSLRRAEEGGMIYATLGEPANAGFLDVIRALGLEAEGADQDASSAYLAGVTRIQQAGDTRLLAGALALFARQQSRAGRPHLAVDLQRESTTLDSADATPQLVAEANAVLAEQLFRSGASAEGARILHQASTVARRIQNVQPRRRAQAIIAQIEAAGASQSDPAAAETALSRFLSEFAGFGERYFRAEALLGRAEARLALGKLPGAEEDLAAALDDIANQSERLENRVQAVTLLDRARDVLDLLVEVLLRAPGGNFQSLAWIERFRAKQTNLGFASVKAGNLQSGRLASAPRGACITEYWSAPAELLAWTSCSGTTPRLDRIEIPRSELLKELGELAKAAQHGNLGALRRQSAAVSAWLIAPIAGSLSGSSSWTVILDALFPAIPVAWLTLDDRFVFEHRVVTAAPSWSQLTVTRSRAPESWRAAAIGDPTLDPSASEARLPFARAEVERLPILFPGSTARTDAAATWMSLLERRGSFNVLHLATHVSSGSRVPLSARLELAPEPGRPDGRVSADDVARVKLAGLRLAVVASCSSAAAAPTKIAGSLDFTRAFLTAGATEVVGTLWDVADRETATAVSEFYDALKAGFSPRQALRKVWLTGLESHAEPADLSVRAGLQMSSKQP